MKIIFYTWWLCSSIAFATFAQNGMPAPSAALLPSKPEGITLWWAISSSAKIQPDQPPPKQTGSAILMSCARNEREAVQLVVRSTNRLEQCQVACSALTGPDSVLISAGQVEILQVMYVNVTQSSDRSSMKGLCPDPLVPISGPLDLQPNSNHAFWVRVFVPSNAPAGAYRGSVELRAKGFQTKVPIELTVYDFALPDRMTCTTAFGFSPGNVFQYHGLKTESEKRLVLEKYWSNLAAHHVSPYDPAPLDPIRTKWPDIRPPATAWNNWTGLRIVSNEVHSGQGALLVYDDKTNENVTAGYEPLIRIPPKGLRVKCWYRTAIPGHRFIVTLTHFDAQRNWMSGRNNDITLRGSGQWQNINELLTGFPPGAEYVRFHVRATIWSDRGEELGLVWFDDISITDPDSGKELVEGGDFERKARTEPVVPLDQLKAQIDFSAWDRAMTQAIDRNHFNSFQLHIPGIGGGTFHEITPPSLLGFEEDTPEYPVLFDSYCRQMEAHLQAKGWLDEAFVYWFDEPSADQYPFVMNGFAKLKRSCPRVARMLTEQVEPGLLGGPDIWCSISDSYDHQRAEERRPHGEKFWWYVCTGPKSPYAGLFLDHSAPEMRIWLWQTFQRNIEGILVWETTYWNSSSAYPDPKQPQNPYTDPMSWTSGYSTPAGDRLPWGNGDGRFIYPPLAAADSKSTAPVLEGPVDSIRWEHLRDGIEDYEYLCILRKLLAQRQPTLSTEAYQKYARLLVVPDNISRSLTEFAADGTPIEEQRKRVALAIEELQYPAGVLKHGPLSVRYFLPDGQNGYYRGTRFDWSGIISRVEYQGHNYFSEFREQHDPLNHDDICGTAEEFGINSPAGYAQARPGEVFLKPGIGLLEKPDDTAYSFARQYRIVQEGKWEVRSGRNQVEFTQDFRGSNGWAYSYTKTLVIDDLKPVLTIRRVLRNTGTRAIDTEHYGHNFMKIDDVPAGPDYVLEFPFELRLGEGSQTQNCIEARGRSLAFLRPIPKDQAVWLRLEGFRSAADNRVTVRNTKTGATMDITTDQPLSRLAFFSQFGVLCPEPFVEVKIPPGGSKEWRTVYTFSTNQKR